MFQKMKNQKGFSLIELLVVVIIIAILAAIAVPIYMKYVKSARSTEAQSAIASIRQAYRAHYNQYGSTENFSIELAMQEIKIGRATQANWEFEVVGSDPPSKFTAISTAEFPEGDGKEVYYDVEEGKYHGYGIDEEDDTNEAADF